MSLPRFNLAQLERRLPVDAIDPALRDALLAEAKRLRAEQIDDLNAEIREDAARRHAEWLPTFHAKVAAHDRLSVRSRAFLHSPATEDGEIPDSNSRVLTRKKANYAKRNDEIRLRWHDGAFTLADAADGAVAGMARREAADVFLALLDRLTGQNRAVSHSFRAGNYAPKIFASQVDRDDYKRPDFERAMESLLHRGAITVIDYGRSGDQRQKLVRAEVSE